MKQITPARSLELAAKAWRPGTKMKVIIVDGWSRGFDKNQTLQECIQAGYSACIADPAIDRSWAQMEEDRQIDDLFDRSDWPEEKSAQCVGHSLPLSQDKRSPAEKAEAIQRYEEYWARNAAHNHHEIDCPNTTGCDHRLKIARPAKGSGDMWDSLATCPYCNGAFFYESRPLRIDAAFKGFI